MGVLATDKNQLIYIYTEESIIGNKILTYVKSSKKATRIINISKEKITNTVWAEILELLNKKFQDLLSFDHPSATKFKGSTNYTFDDWLKIIEHNPSLLQKPIVIVEEKAEILSSHSDFYKFYDADGANFDKSPQAIKNGKHKDTTGDKNSNI